MKKEQLDLVKEKKETKRKELSREEYAEYIRNGEFYKLSKCIWKENKK